MHRDLRGELQPRRVGPAVVGGPVVVGPRQRRGIVGREIVVAQDLAAARAIHDRDIDPFDVHRRQGRDRVVAARPRHPEMRMSGAAAAPQFAAGHRRANRVAWAGIASPCTSMPMMESVLALSSAALVQGFLLTAEKARRVCPVGAVEPAVPKVIGLHHVEIAIEDQKSRCVPSPPPRVVWEATLVTEVGCRNRQKLRHAKDLFRALMMRFVLPRRRAGEMLLQREPVSLPRASLAVSFGWPPAYPSRRANLGLLEITSRRRPIMASPQRFDNRAANGRSQGHIRGQGSGLGVHGSSPAVGSDPSSEPVSMT